MAPGPPREIASVSCLQINLSIKVEMATGRDPVFRYTPGHPLLPPSTAASFRPDEHLTEYVPCSLSLTLPLHGVPATLAWIGRRPARHVIPDRMIFWSCFETVSFGKDGYRALTNVMGQPLSA